MAVFIFVMNVKNGVEMYKIAICGKANTGKSTVSKLLYSTLIESSLDMEGATIKYLAFADPIKEMIRIAYPEVPRKWLYGSSKYRAEIIPGASYNGVPLTVRQCLINIGNDFGRANKPDIWLRNFDVRFQKEVKRNTDIIIVTDVRFRNEFDHLKSLGFYQIRLMRNEYTKINDISETNQDGIFDSEFDYVFHNNGTLNDLENEVKKIVSRL